jgi:hypothetical protein
MLPIPPPIWLPSCAPNGPPNIPPTIPPAMLPTELRNPLLIAPKKLQIFELIYKLSGTEFASMPATF